jgi:hypothetical protein
MRATLCGPIDAHDGKGKACVRLDEGTDAIVGGSHVER